MSACLRGVRPPRSGRASISSTRRLPLANMSVTASGSTTWKRLEPSSAAATMKGTRRTSAWVAVKSSMGVTATRTRARVIRAPSLARGRGESGSGR